MAAEKENTLCLAWLGGSQVGDIASSANVVVAWGDGSFGPTSRGHASAPNKKLRKQLAEYFPIVLVKEYNTSKKVCCCRSGAKTDLKRPGYTRRATVFRCDVCNILLSRDMCAAVNIANAPWAFRMC